MTKIYASLSSSPPIFLLLFNPNSRIVFVLTIRIPRPPLGPLNISSPVPGSLCLCRWLDSAAISFLRGCPPFLLSDPMTSCIPQTPSRLRFTGFSCPPQLFCDLLLFQQEFFVSSFTFFKCCSSSSLIFLRRLRPSTRAVLSSSSFLSCVGSSSPIDKRSSSPVRPSLQLYCHVPFPSLINNPISYRTFVTSFLFESLGVCLVHCSCELVLPPASSVPGFHPKFACQPFDDHAELLFDVIALLKFVSFFPSPSTSFYARGMRYSLHLAL